MVWDGYTPEPKIPKVTDRKFLEWSSETLTNLGEYVKGVKQDISDYEDIISSVNAQLRGMCELCSFIKFKSFVVDTKACFQGGNRFFGRYNWYPAILHTNVGSDARTPNGVLKLGVMIYTVSGLMKDTKNPNTRFLLSYKNMNHSPEVIEAYKKCVGVIPELLISYEDFIVDTMPYIYFTPTS